MIARSVMPVAVPAARELLLAAPALVTRLGGPKVYTYVPEEAVAPWIAVLGGQERPWEQFKTRGRQGDLLVTTVSTYRGTTEVDEITDLVMQALDDQGLTLEGFEGARLDWMGNREPPPPQEWGSQLWFTRTAVFRVLAK
ncbi:MAG: DUF3168 domain-containing protein [Acidobacteria bacterium]|nr:DUF3168 domain-containing protein [Acidobacteriota bacterium]